MTVDFEKLGKLLLPIRLRQSLIYAYIKAIDAPFTYIQSKFKLFRDDIAYRLLITPQVILLEKMLNDRYDNSLRRITITDGTFQGTVYLYRADEQFDKIIYLDDENINLYLNVDDEIGYVDNMGFLVNVPSAVTFINNEMEQLINYYKLPSINYTINVA